MRVIKIMEEIQQKRVPRNRRTTSVELNNYKLDEITKVIQTNLSSNYQIIKTLTELSKSRLI